MYLFFDTETTGLPKRYSAPASDVENWPRVVQLAWLLTNDKGKELEKAQFIVRPDKFTIPPEASAIHGITTEIARRDGVSLRNVLQAFHVNLRKADILIAHNFDFDQRVLMAEFVRTKRDHEHLSTTSHICTMRESTNFCRLPGNSYGYKWPKLIELHNSLFGRGFESAHNAMADVEACARCFFELRRRGVLPHSKRELA